MLAVLGITIVVAGCGGGGDLIPPFNLYPAIALEDLDGDGVPDIAVAGSRIAGSPPHPGFVSVIRQHRTALGTFLTGVHYAAGSDLFGLAIGDLNGDGKPDLVALSTTLSASGTTAMPLTVLLQDPASPGAFVASANLPAGVTNKGLALGDLNGDEQNDLVVGGCSAGVLVFLQSAAGTFSAPFSLAAGACPGGVAIGDLNGDGAPDLAVASTDGAGGGSVWVLLQDANHPGTFVPGRRFSAGLQPIAVEIAAINGDGFADLAVANLGSPENGNTASVSVLWNNPSDPGNFLPAVNYATGFRSGDVAVGDLDGDCRSDLVIANAGALTTTGSVSVLLQDQFNPGVFLPATNYPGLSQPLAVDIGDLNGDGRPDVAVADGDRGAAVMFQKSDASGNFLPSLPVGK